MAALPVGQNDDARAGLANYGCDLQPVLPRVFDSPIRDVEGVTPGRAENFRGVGGFTGAIVGGAARTHLALGQVEDAGALSVLRSFQQRAAAGLLDVVAVRGYGENVEGRRRH